MGSTIAPPDSALTTRAEPLACKPLTDSDAVEDCLVVVGGQYHELAARHNELVDWVDGVVGED